MLKNQHGKGKRLVYIASPYSLNGVSNNEKLKQMDARAFNVAMFMAEMMLKHYKDTLFFGPIVQGHLLNKHMPAKSHTYEMWIDETDDYWVTNCDEVWVCCLAKWNESQGVLHEISLAESLDKKVRFFNPRSGQEVSYDKATDLG